jgi:hypothetical protein
MRSTPPNKPLHRTGNSLVQIDLGCSLAAYWVDFGGDRRRCCRPVNADPLCSSRGGTAIRRGRRKPRQRGSPYDVEDGLLLVVLVFWGFQLHLFDILATVWFSVRDYRLAWLHPGGSGLSYFQSNIAIAVSLLTLSALFAIRAWWSGSGSRALVVPLSFVLFVSLFSYRLVFLGNHMLSDEWYAEAISDEPWDDRGHYLGLVLEASEDRMATILLEDHTEIVLRLPSGGEPSRVVGVVERRARYSGSVQYESVFYVPYDDLELFLSQYTSLEAPR